MLGKLFPFSEMKLVLQIVAVASFIVKQYVAQQSEPGFESDEDFDESISVDEISENSAVMKKMLNHTFVALIDIVFTDNSKRTCTGTIIHDNVIVTAAHCFSKNYDKYIKPELTASFVVIGSKKMFEVGYEQYLPIERIVNHPRFRGWTADIALVYTFAGMMSDKPGTIMPLAGEKMSTPSHSNVTVLSWGHCKENDMQKRVHGKHDWKKPTKFPLRANAPLSSIEEESSSRPKIKNPKAKLTHQLKSKEKTYLEKSKKTKTTKRNKKHSTKRKRASEYVYRAVTSSNEGTYDDSAEYMNRIESSTKDDNLYNSFFKDWRRSIGPDNNELTVETFRFVSMKNCAEMISKALPDKYQIKNIHEYACYASDDHYVTDEDAGAPAIRHGHLIAMTVGGVECDGERVAVGIKISCFCSWIAENLPDENMNLKCCDQCCDEVKSLPPPQDDKKEEVIGRKKKKSKF